MRTIVIGDRAVLVEKFELEKFSNDEVLRLKRLILWEYDGSKKAYLLTRRFAHKVGRVVVKNTVFSVVPDMLAQDFTTFFLFSLGVRLDKFLSHQSSSIAASYGNTHPDFRSLAATLLILTAEELAGSYLAKGYVTRRERLSTIRGRIDWMSFLRPGKQASVPCVFSEISVDNLLNRVVLAGLHAVQDVAILPVFRRRLNEQIFSWSSIASGKHINLADLQVAENSINRLTEKYRAAIGLCRMVMFGYGPDDFFNAGNSHFQCLEFDLSMIFERFVLRLINQRLHGSQLSVEGQVREKNGLRDGYGKTYHETRPDYVIKCKGVPVAVLDAKFKPRYVSLYDSSFTNRNKVTEADIYQVLYYAQRAGQLANGAAVPAFIVSPRVDVLATVPNSLVRRINWIHEGQPGASIDVVDVDLPGTVRAIRQSQDFPFDGLAAACQQLLQEHSPTAALA